MNANHLPHAAKLRLTSAALPDQSHKYAGCLPPRFTRSPQLTVEGWRLTITGAPNKWVHIERSSDLRNWEEDWSAGRWVWMGPEGVKQLNVENTGDKVRFYRVVVE